MVDKERFAFTRLEEAMALPALALVLLVATCTGAEACGETRDGADKGIVRPPRPLRASDRLNCTWVLRATPGLRLLVRLDSVQLPSAALRSAALRLSVDGRVSEITRDCVNCLDATLAGETVEVHFVSSPLADGSEPGSFQLRYRAFDPNQCERPRPPSQGYVVGRDWRLGREVRFACNPPLDPLGHATVARCEPGGDGVPRWSRAAPRCAASDCRRGPVRRDAGAGAIASPGYLERRLPANRRCEWHISAPPGHQVWATFTQLRLPGATGGDGPQLYLFDGDESTPLANMSGVQLKPPPLNVTSVSNRLIVLLLTSARPADDAVVYMEYAARPAACPEPAEPASGTLVAHSLGVGSRVAYRCDSGHAMVGEPAAECLPSGEWSASPPQCVPQEEPADDQQDVSEDAHVAAPAHDDLAVPLGGPRGFTVSPATTTDLAATVINEEEPVTTAVTTLPPLLPTTAVPPSSEEALDPLPQSSKLDRDRWKPYEQDINRAAVLAKGPPRKPSAHMDPWRASDHAAVLVGEELLPHGTEPGDVATSGVDNDLDIPDRGGSDGLEDGLTVTMVAVIVAVTAPLAIALLLLIVLVAYRRRYPVRMIFGRKFSTFENPAYVRKDAQNPRELTRLSIADRDRF
ncbi:CUB and sushi domain-containing protein 3-like isoform X2 [Dermacentor albipictus]|uniref:CUB and sushi domain-containing protein 3-like isoform X2 n=1 Tax=Dermacentor albipictus TaxID=60249 RepID=UPI0031FE14F6